MYLKRTVGFVVTTATVTVILTATVILAVAEEIPWLPDIWMKKASKKLTKNRTLRNLYICFIIGIIFLATIIDMVKSNLQRNKGIYLSAAIAQHFC